MNRVYNIFMVTYEELKARYKQIYIKYDTYDMLTRLKIKYGTYDNAIKYLLKEVFSDDRESDKELSDEQESRDIGFQDGEQRDINKIKIIIV